MIFISIINFDDSWIFICKSDILILSIKLLENKKNKEEIK